MSMISSTLRYEIRQMLHDKVSKLTDAEIDELVNRVLNEFVRERLRSLGEKSK